MTEVLPKWEMHAYALLWKKYNEKEFFHEEASNFLKQKKEVISTLFYDLKKAGWLDVSLSPNDSRKRMYKLKSPEKAILNIL